MEIARVLKQMRTDWKVNGEKEGQILKPETSKQRGKKPDIIVELCGRSPIIIETEIMPARTLESDVREKLNCETVYNKKIHAVIGIRLPLRFKKHEGDELQVQIKNADDFEYVIYNPQRFPENGWLRGKITEIASITQIISINADLVKDGVYKMFYSINAIAAIINKCDKSVQQEITQLLYQTENEQTWKMAGLILSNAFIFQANIKSLDCFAFTTPVQIMKIWDDILKINYFAIFKIARSILGCLKESEAVEIVTELNKMYEAVTKTGLRYSTEMYGPLIQQMINDRKTLASFYTRSESAVLLAGLTAPPPKPSHTKTKNQC